MAAPLLYAACNILSSPRIDSIDTIWDEHSREPLGQLLSDNEYVQIQILCELKSSFNNLFFSSIVPAICDLDVATVNRLMDLNEVNRSNNMK
jgi:hypothetical protein